MFTSGRRDLSINQPYNEQALLSRIAEGDTTAFRTLFDHYRPKLYSYLLRMSASAEVAEDCVHDVFLKLWCGRDKLVNIQNFNAYLYRMAHNHALNNLRKMAVETLVVAELTGPVPPSADDPGRALHNKEVQQFIRQAVGKLTPRQREVFLLSRESGLKQAEIAERLGMKVATVKAHLTDALNFLRNEISARYGSYAIILFILFDLAH